jgi:hypothetical protein
MEFFTCYGILFTFLYFQFFGFDKETSTMEKTIKSMDVKPVLTSGFPFYFFMGAACFRLPKL